MFQVLVKVGFNYPIFLTFIHYVCSWLIMALLKAFSLLPPPPSSKTTKFSSLLGLGIVMSLSTGLANVSLKFNRYATFVLINTLCIYGVQRPSNFRCFLTKSIFSSVGFYQMAKIAVTPAIVLAEFMLYRKRISFRKVTSVV